MINQTRIQSMLDDARWASKTLAGDHSNISVHLVSFPGVVGGVFRAQVVGVLPEYFGQVSALITCTGVDVDHLSRTERASTPETYFQEIESLSVQDLSFEVMFRIPFEAKGSEEGAVWHLSINFANGVSETFEIPVCRTSESNPKITAVQIAATRDEQEERWQTRSQKSVNHNGSTPYALTQSNDELTLRLPASSARHVNALTPGLKIFAGLWATVIAFFYWVSGGDLEPVVMLGLPLIVMLMFLVFLFFGVSHCKIDKDQVKVTHKLFGVPVNWVNANRHDIEGFATLFLSAVPRRGVSSSSYFVTGKYHNKKTLLLCLTTFNQKDARALAKQLNEFLGVVES